MKTKGTPLFFISKKFPANLEHLNEVGEHIQHACLTAGFDAAVTYSIRLAVDEAFSNIIEHAYHSAQGAPDIDFTCAVDEFALYVNLHDHGESFNPTDIPAPDIAADIVQRPRGGLGLYFMRRLMDEIEFQFIPEDERADSSATGNFLLMTKYRIQHDG